MSQNKKLNNNNSKVSQDTGDGHSEALASDPISNIELPQEKMTDMTTAVTQLDLAIHALRSISEAVSITDMEDIVLFVNRAFRDTYGFEQNELLGKPIDFIRSPNNPLEVVQEILPATLQGGWQGELYNLRKDGSEFPIALSSSVVRDEEGEPIALIGVASDITKRRLEEKALQRQNAYLAALHDTTLGLISRLDLKELLETLLARAAELLDTPHGFLYLVEGDDILRLGSG